MAAGGDFYNCKKLFSCTKVDSNIELFLLKTPLFEWLYELRHCFKFYRMHYDG